MARDPIVDLGAFTDRNFALGSLFSFVLGIGLYGLTYIYPLYLAQIRGLNACDIAQGRLKDSGTDFAISIKLPGIRRAYTIYPRAGAYIETSLTWREELKEIAEITKTKLRDDTLDGHPCVQYRVHVINKLGDADFNVRIAASEQLKKMGRPALPDLERAAQPRRFHADNAARGTAGTGACVAQRCAHHRPEMGPDARRARA